MDTNEKSNKGKQELDENDAKTEMPEPESEPEKNNKKEKESGNKDYTEKGKSKIGVFFEKVGRILLLPFQIMLDFIHSVASWLKSKAFGDEYMTKEGYRENKDLERYESRQAAKQNIKHIEKVSEKWIEQAKMNGERSENDISQVKCRVSSLGSDNPKAVYQFTVKCENNAKYTIFADKNFNLDSKTICPEEVMVQLQSILDKCKPALDYVSPENRPNEINEEKEDVSEEIPEEVPDENQKSEEPVENEVSKPSKNEPPNALVWEELSSEKDREIKNVLNKKIIDSYVKRYNSEHEKYSYEKRPMKTQSLAKMVADQVLKAQKSSEGIERKALLFYNGDVSVLVEKNKGCEKDNPTCSITAYDNKGKYNSVCTSSVALNYDALKNAINFVIELQTTKNEEQYKSTMAEMEVKKALARIDKTEFNDIDKITVAYNGSSIKLNDINTDVKEFFFNNNGILQELNVVNFKDELSDVMTEYNEHKNEAIRLISKRGLYYDIAPNDNTTATVNISKLYVDDERGIADLAPVLSREIDISSSKPNIELSVKELLDSIPEQADDLIYEMDVEQEIASNEGAR